MAVPKKRQNKSRRDRRRGGQLNKLKNQSFIKCPQCGALMMPHRICSQCGYYKSEDILNKSVSKED